MGKWGDGHSLVGNWAGLCVLCYIQLPKPLNCDQTTKAPRTSRSPGLEWPGLPASHESSRATRERELEKRVTGSVPLTHSCTVGAEVVEIPVLCSGMALGQISVSAGRERERGKKDDLKEILTWQKEFIRVPLNGPLYLRLFLIIWLLKNKVIVKLHFQNHPLR